MEFKNWLERHLSDNIPSNVIAFNFNIYESSIDNQYDVQLVGSSYYSIDDENWACNTIYSTGEDLFSFNSASWEIALNEFIEFVKKFLHSCDENNRLKQAEYITAGFVDGNLEIIFRK